MTILAILRGLSLPLWTVIAFTTVPGAWRFFRGRPRSLDAIWLGGLILALNRISFQINSLFGPGLAMQIWCYATSVAAAAIWLGIIRSYQRHDA